MTKKSKTAMAEAEVIATAENTVASVKFKDINIVVGGLESEQGACAALDCNDKNIGETRTAATSWVDAVAILAQSFSGVFQLSGRVETQSTSAPEVITSGATKYALGIGTGLLRTQTIFN
jgi:hypothetical protein